MTKTMKRQLTGSRTASHPRRFRRSTRLTSSVRCGLLSLLSAVLIVLLMGGQTPVVGASVVPVRAVANDTAGTIIAIPTGTPQSQQASGCGCTRFSSLEVRVLDSSGNPEGEVTVTFTSPSSGPSVGFGDGGKTDQQVTDAQGFATVSDAYANGTIGSYEVSATAPGTSTPAVFYLTNTEGTPYNLNPVLSRMAQSTPVGTAFALPLRARLTVSFGNLATGVAITFTAFTGLESGFTGHAGVTFSGRRSTVSEYTNADGVATAPSLTANSTPGTFLVTASMTGAYDPAVFDMTNLSSLPVTIIAIPTGTPQSQQASGCGCTRFSSLEVRVLDSSGNPEGEVTVTFTSPSSGPSVGFGDGGKTDQQVTDAQGFATVSDAYANGTIGSYEVSATAPGTSTPAVFYLTNTEGTPYNLNPVLSTMAQSTPVGTAFALPLRARLTDSSGNLATGVTITFTAFTGLESGFTGHAGATFSGRRSTVSEYTNADGVATAPSLTANSTPGTFLVTASVTGAYDPAVFHMTGTETTTTVLTLTTPKLTYGHEQTEHLSATVSPEFAGPTPSGSVTIKESATTLCVITLSAAKGSCRLSPKKLKVGTYRLVATYGGSTNFKHSASVKETLTVVKASSKTALKLSNAKLTYGDEQVEHLSVTVSPEFAGLTPTGTVTVKESTTTLCVITLLAPRDRAGCPPRSSRWAPTASSPPTVAARTSRARLPRRKPSLSPSDELLPCRSTGCPV